MADPGFAEFFGGCIVGAIGTFGALVSYARLVGTPARATAKPQTGFAWARADNVFVETTRTGETARVVHTAADDLPEGRYLTFCIHDSRTGLDRDVTIPARQVWAFMREDNPTQGNVRVRHDTYSQMLSVAKFNKWVTLQGKRYEWEPALGTRERRLRMFQAWGERGGPQ